VTFVVRGEVDVLTKIERREERQKLRRESVCRIIEINVKVTGFVGSSAVSSPSGVRSRVPINKKLSYRRGTERCVVSVEILPIATQQCSTSPEQIELMKLGVKVGRYSRCVSKHVHSTVTCASRFHCLIGVINKPTSVELCITCIPTTCCGEIF